VIEQLEQVCFAVGSVREPDAEKVIDAVNRKLGTLLNAHVIKLYWKQEADRGGVILRPVSYINEAEVPDPQPFSITSECRGVLEWVFATGRPLWLQDVQRQYRDETVVNLATDEPVATELLQFADPPQSDAMIVVPLRERGVTHGLYSIELPSSRGLNPRVKSLVERLGRALGTMLYNADVFEYDMRKSGRAINQFLNSVQSFSFDRVLLDQDWRTTFVARPYKDEFLRVQQVVEHLLLSKGIRARHYESENRQYVVNEIIGQIRNSHFCIADLTGNNLNVVAEVGMMMVLNKKPLVLRRKGDDSPIPFDLSQFSFWEYELGRDDGLLVQSPAAGRLVPFDEVLERFLNELPPENGFFLAKEWRPEAQTVSSNGSESP
jgi:hypothetical protein